MLKKLSFAVCILYLSLSCSDPEKFIYPNDGLVIDKTLTELKAVGQYSGASTCTAVFVRFSENLQSPAYVLTNGHCVQGWSQNEVNFNVPATDHYVTFNMFKDSTSANKVKIQAKKIAYSTMKGTDLGIVELNATVGELAQKGIKPFNIAGGIPKSGTAIKSYGIPVTGIPQESQFLRQSSSVVMGKTDLIEFSWSWWDMYATMMPDIKGGSSGSPVFADLKDGVIGLINTTTIDAESPCYLGAPCESVASGIRFSQNTSYFLSVTELKGCFNTEGVFNPDAPGCKLDKGKQANIEGSPIGAINPTINLAGSNTPAQKNWNYTILDQPYYRYKIGKMGTSNPRDINGYGQAIQTSVKPKIEDLLPVEEGHYYLAVIGGPSPVFDQTWQQPAFATLARIEVDKKAPTKEPSISVNDFDDSYRVSLNFSPPELGNYLYKIGDLNADPNDMKGYVTYRRIPLNINKKDLPVKICVIGYDMAGNPTKPATRSIFK